MTEHTVWAIIDKYDGRLHHVSIDQNPIGDSLVTRCVEATLIIPDEPEWTVGWRDASVYIINGGGAAWMAYCPDFSVVVRAPDAQTALARALEQRGTG